METDIHRTNNGGSKLIRIHLAFFFLDILRDPMEISQKLSKNLNFLAGEVISFRSFPPPIIQTNKKGEKLLYSFGVIPDRCDFTVYEADPSINVKKEFMEKYPLIIDEIFKLKQIGRIGLIRYFFRDCDSPQDAIEKEYINRKTKISHVDEISIRYNKKGIFNKIHTNNVNIIEATPNNIVDKKGILITNDTNTVFNKDGISAVYAKDFIGNSLERDIQ